MKFILNEYLIRCEIEKYLPACKTNGTTQQQTGLINEYYYWFYCDGTPCMQV